jgi:hypothetical protein
LKSYPNHIAQQLCMGPFPDSEHRRTGLRRMLFALKTAFS